jgi:predicted O-methyltransferase YrrM
MKRFYVSVVRAMRSALSSLGLLRILDRLAEGSPRWLWVRSLFSIYDVEEMTQWRTPWWTLKSVDLVDSFLRTREDPTVFEWGSGASSLWLADRVRVVHSIEHDQSWADVMRSKVPQNVDLRVVQATPVAHGSTAEASSSKAGFEGLDFSDYVSAIEQVPGRFDVVVVDGRAREACLSRAVGRLADGGIIVLDNVERARYRQAISALGDQVQVSWTRGLTLSLPYPTRTAILRLT